MRSGEGLLLIISHRIVPSLCIYEFKMIYMFFEDVVHWAIMTTLFIINKFLHGMLIQKLLIFCKSFQVLLLDRT